LANRWNSEDEYEKNSQALLRTIAVVSWLFPLLSMAQAQTKNEPTHRNNPELEKIFYADQTDVRPMGTQEERKATMERTLSHREQVTALLAQGGLQTAEDYFRAAIIFQHSQAPDDHLMAHVLANVAAFRGHTEARWLSAAALDAYLTSTGKSQIFGTGYLKTGDRKMTPDFLNDVLRREYCVPPLAQQEKNVSAIQSGTPGQRVQQLADHCLDSRAQSPAPPAPPPPPPPATRP
jgi:hypothetical protein